MGTGVYKVLKMQEEEIPRKVGAELAVKKILVRDLRKAALKVDDPSVLTNDWKEILDDESIEIVVEVMGGMEPARTYMVEALAAGKNVVRAAGSCLIWQSRARRICFLRQQWQEGFRLSPRSNSLWQGII